MKSINIKSIRVDGGTQSRVEINNEIVAEYAAQIKDGAEFPPVVVFNDGTDMWLADGFHRFHAHNTAGKASIAADVRTGTVRDAKLYSFGANGKHGNRPSNADKKKSVTEMLKDSEWGDWSDHSIAKTCHVSQPFVGTVRRTLDSENPNVTDNVISEKRRKYTTKHGGTATMKVDKKATPAKPEPVAVEPIEEKPAPKEYASDGESIKEDEECTELDAAHITIQELQDMLAVANLSSVSTEEQTQAANLIAELRKEIKSLHINLKAVTRSRDQLQNEVAQLTKQCTSQQNQIKRLKA